MRKITALLGSICILTACESTDPNSPAADGTPSASPSAETPTAPDNTYVGDVDVGDLSLKQVWIPDVGQSGYEFKVWFDLSTKKSKEKVYVTLDFVRLETGNASDLKPNSADFASEYPKIAVGAFVVDKIEPGAPVHVEQAFTLPSNLPDGKYAAVFGINQIDLFPEINAAQGETAAEDPARQLIAPATVIVGKPDKPNLRVLTSSLTENYFTRPVVDPAHPDAVAPRHIQVNLEVDSMAVDTTNDVDVAFTLNIGGQVYPLKVGSPVPATDPTQPGTALRLLDRWTYKAGDVKLPAIPDDIEPEEVPLHSTGPIAVATQIPIGRTFDLYLPDSAWNALTADATGEVVATIDPDNKIKEWGTTAAEQKGDNVKRHPVQYLVAPPAKETTGSKGACHTFYNASQQYGTVVKDLQNAADYGNSKFKIGYGLRGIMSGADTSVKFGTYNYIAGKIFGFDIKVLDANAELDSDMDCGSYYGYRIDVFGIRRFADGEEFDAGESKTLWESDDYKLSEEFEQSTTFMVGGIVPIDVSGGLTGEIGVVPRVSVGPLLRLNAEIAPYASLTGTASGGVNLAVVRGGVGIELLLLKLTATNTLWVELPFKTDKYQGNPPYTALTLNYKLPLKLESLDGRFYLFADRRNWRWKWVRIGELDIVNWTGLSWTYDLVPTQTKTFSLIKQ